jgi:hypothetical protein
MESFTLGPTPKIDFSLVQQQHTTTFQISLKFFPELSRVRTVAL